MCSVEEIHVTNEEFVFSSDTSALPYHIPHLACSVYHMTLKDLPAMVRLWWNSSEKRVFNIVDRFTSKYVSSVLSFQEISSVQTSTQLFNGMTVSIILNFFLEKLSQYWLCLSVVVSMITIVALGSEIKEIVYFLILGHQISN